MNFSDALNEMKKGNKLQRSNWNGKNQFVVMMDDLHLPCFNSQNTNVKVNERTAKFIGFDTDLHSVKYCALFNAQKQWVPGWLPSQGDLFADDWQLAD